MRLWASEGRYGQRLIRVRRRHAHHCVRGAVCFLFELIVRGADSEFRLKVRRLDQVLYGLVANRLLQARQRMFGARLYDRLFLSITAARTCARF